MSVKQMRAKFWRDTKPDPCLRCIDWNKAGLSSSCPSCDSVHLARYDAKCSTAGISSHSERKVIFFATSDDARKFVEGNPAAGLIAKRFRTQTGKVIAAFNAGTIEIIATSDVDGWYLHGEDIKVEFYANFPDNRRLKMRALKRITRYASDNSLLCDETQS